MNGDRGRMPGVNLQPGSFGIGDSGLGVALSAGGRSFDPAAIALFARMAVQPDATRMGHIDTLIADLKACGVWQKLDFMFIFAAHNPQAARLNWIEANEAVAVAAPAFTVDRGYKGDAVAAYIELPYGQASLVKAGTALDNNASWLAGVRQPGEFLSRFVLGATTGIRFALSFPSGTSVAFRNGQGTAADTFNSPLTGRFASTRSGATAHQVFRNGASLGATTTVSQASSSVNIRLLMGGSVYVDAEVTHYLVGSALTPTQQADADVALDKYLTAIGCTFP